MMAKNSCCLAFTIISKKKDFIQKKLREKRIELIKFILEMINTLFLKNLLKVKNILIWTMWKISI